MLSCARSAFLALVAAAIVATPLFGGAQTPPPTTCPKPFPSGFFTLKGVTQVSNTTTGKADEARFIARGRTDVEEAIGTAVRLVVIELK